MATDLATYLSFDGQCETAFKHYEKVLRGKILMMMRHADAPAGSGVPQNPETANRIMHARLKVGDCLLMGGDAPPLGPNSFPKISAERKSFVLRKKTGGRSG
jgi:uncharacterized glyoxalase superfamily protein PhnB